MADIRKQLKKKDEELFEEVRKLKNATPTDNNRLYELSHKYVSKIIYDIVKDPYTTEDLTQEAYMRIYNNLDSLKEPEAFYVWAGRIATNLTFRYIQKNRHEVLVEADEEGNTDFVFDNVSDDREEMIPETVLMDREKQRIIADILDSLSIEQKLSVQYFYYEEMSVREIAETMGVSEGTVKSRLNYARNKIKDAVIEMDVKHGTRLYSLSALPVLMLIFRGVSEGFIAAGAVGAASAAATGSAVAGTSTGGASAAGVTGRSVVSAGADTMGANATAAGGDVIGTKATANAGRKVEGIVKSIAGGKASAGAAATTASASSGVSAVTGGISAFIGTTVGKVVAVVIIMIVVVGSGTVIHHAVKPEYGEAIVEEIIEEPLIEIEEIDEDEVEEFSEEDEEEVPDSDGLDLPDGMTAEEYEAFEKVFDAVWDMYNTYQMFGVPCSEVSQSIADAWLAAHLPLQISNENGRYYRNNKNGDSGSSKNTSAQYFHSERVIDNDDPHHHKIINQIQWDIADYAGPRRIHVGRIDTDAGEEYPMAKMNYDSFLDQFGDYEWNKWNTYVDLDDKRGIVLIVGETSGTGEIEILDDETRISVCWQINDHLFIEFSVYDEDSVMETEL